MTTLDYQSPQTALDQSASPVRWLGWAIFLGMSWTWCIGMFLPVLLVRDYGPWAWLAFAIPNVVGAGAMGWVLSAAGSDGIVRNHRFATKAFSWLTAAFQIFFAFWIFASLHARAFTVWTLVAGALCFFAAADDRSAMAAACAALFLSCVVIFSADDSRSLDVLGQFQPGSPSGDQLGNLILLTPVMLLGFLLCPYLDSTFHHVRQRTNDRSSRAAFTIGFSLFFLLMIVYSLAYAWIVAHGIGGSELAKNLLLLHWCAQLGLTIGYHWRIGTSGNRSVDSPRLRLMGTTAIGYLAWRAGRFFGDPLVQGGETIYRLFMSFYGLVFPAYVYLCMLPTRGREKPSRRSLAVLAAVCIVAAPMYWMGFIERKTWWLLPGVGVVLLARVLISARALNEPRPSGSGRPHASENDAS